MDEPLLESARSHSHSCRQPDQRVVAGARRERSVRRHRQGCRPAVLKFEELTVQHVHRRPSSVLLTRPTTPTNWSVLPCPSASAGAAFTFQKTAITAGATRLLFRAGLG